jgi:hypothetical protein
LFQKKNDKNPIELEINGNRLYQLCEVAEAFAACCISSVFNNHGMHKFSTDFQSSDSVPRASVCDSDVLKDARRLRPSKSVGLDDTPACIINGCSDMFLNLYSIAADYSVFSLPSGRKLSFFPIFKKRKDCLSE